MQDPLASQDTRITVALDAMGGDQAPRVVVDGALAAARQWPNVRVILVGDEAAIRGCLAGAALPGNVVLRHASQVVDMCDAPGAAVRHKRDSSISVGITLVRGGEAQAFLSVGNSGAVMAAAMVILKPQPGVDRPAIATLIPTKREQVVLLDAGATADCKPHHLVQFARLGEAYARAVLGRARPRVGLLSIGEEPTKGDELTKETHQLLLQAEDVHFVGNIEPKEMVRGEVDVVVCDGFVGNLMLKAGEGFGELIRDLLKQAAGSSLLARIGGLLLRPALRGVFGRFDYAAIGGAALLGVNGVVLIGHGRSDARAITNAIGTAATTARCMGGGPSAPTLPDQPRKQSS